MPSLYDRRQFASLAHWWRAGGRIIFQNPDAERERQLDTLREQARKSRIPQATGPAASDNWWPVPDGAAWVVDALLDGLLSLGAG